MAPTSTPVLVLPVAAAAVVLGVGVVDVIAATIGGVGGAKVEGRAEVVELVVELVVDGSDILDNVGGRLPYGKQVIRWFELMEEDN
jgi:hypothetical protein